MPIDIERFEQGKETELRSGGTTNAGAILSFLASRPDQAFTPKEIHIATDVARGSVGVVLSRLEDRGLVRHRGEYWAVADVDDVEKTLSAMGTARAVTERFGPEDPEEWGPGVDPESGSEEP
jgi:DNA-binding transcriptional ArsR family regulator